MAICAQCSVGRRLSPPPFLDDAENLHTKSGMGDGQSALILCWRQPTLVVAKKMWKRGKWKAKKGNPIEGRPKAAGGEKSTARISPAGAGFIIERKGVVTILPLRLYNS
jgi:hypothetical protein